MSTTTRTETQTQALRLRPQTQQRPSGEVFDLNTTYGDWRDDLARDGYVIIRGAVPTDRAVKYHSDFHGLLEDWGLGYDRNDKSTWVKEHLPTVRTGGMVSLGV